MANPSMVVTSCPRTCFTGSWQDRTASLPTITVQAPQRLAPQPNLVPVSPRSVRNTHKSMRSPSTSNFAGLPLSRKSMVSFIAVSSWIDDNCLILPSRPYCIFRDYKSCPYQLSHLLLFLMLGTQPVLGYLFSGQRI